MTFGYDFSDTEEYGDFVTLTPGRYIFALAKAEKGESGAGNPKAIITLRVMAGNQAYIGGSITQHWPTNGKGAFRFRAMLRALGIDLKDKGKIALEKYYDDEFGARVTLQEGKELTEAGEVIFFHELNAILPASQYEDLLDDVEEDEDEPEDEEEEGDEEEEFEDEEDDDDEDEEGITIEDLDDMDLGELKELAKEWEVSTKPDKGKKKLGVAQMRRRLAEVIEGEDDEEDEDDEEENEEEDEGLTEEDLAELNLAELRGVADENDVKLPKPKKGKKLSAARVRKILVEALFGDEDEDDDEEPF